VIKVVFQNWLRFKTDDLAALRPAETVRIQHLRITDVDDACVIQEELHRHAIGDRLSQGASVGQHLKLDIRLGVGNIGLPGRSHVAAALAARFQHRIPLGPALFNDLGHLLQQHLLGDDDKLFGWFSHVGYLFCLLL